MYLKMREKDSRKSSQNESSEMKNSNVDIKDPSSPFPSALLDT